MHSMQLLGGDHNPHVVVDRGDGGDHFIPLGAIASWGELLGYSDPKEALQAIIYSEGKEPDPDPLSEKNVWTDAYTLLTAREQAREDEARKAQQEGTADDPRSPKLRSALAAYNAVHQPINGGECAMDRCRRAARDAMGLPEPSKKCGASSRGSTAKILNTATETAAVLTPEALDYLSKARSTFLHSLVEPDDDNPLGDTPPPPEPENPILSADELMQKFGGTA